MSPIMQSSGDDGLDRAIKATGTRLYTARDALRDEHGEDEALRLLVQAETLALLMVGLDGPDAGALRRACIAIGGPDGDTSRAGGAILGFLLGLTYARVEKPLQTVTGAR